MIGQAPAARSFALRSLAANQIGSGAGTVQLKFAGKSEGELNLQGREG